MKITEFKNKFDFLSNFKLCNIHYEGIYYPSVEHAYQSSKTNNMLQKQHLSTIMDIPSYKAKKFGRKLHIKTN